MLKYVKHPERDLAGVMAELTTSPTPPSSIIQVYVRDGCGYSTMALDQLAAIQPHLPPHIAVVVVNNTGQAIDTAPILGPIAGYPTFVRIQQSVGASAGPQELFDWIVDQ